MTKQDLVKEIANVEGISKPIVEAVINSFVNSVKSNVKAGKTIYIRGFATIGTKLRKQKVGRNITKNTPIIIPEHKIPSFKAAPEFKNSLK